MLKKFLIIILVLMFFTGCSYKTSNKKVSNYSEMICYKEAEENDISSSNIVNVIFEDEKIFKITIKNDAYFSRTSLKYFNSEVKYLSQLYESLGKIEGITSEFTSEDYFYTGSLTINYNIIKTSDLENLNIDYNFNKNTKQTDLILKLEADNYKCE
jgi:uncharacterized lipoprotein YehR (DUF1307 family)